VPEKLSIPSDLSEARKLERKVLEQVARHGYSGSATFAIKLALEEGLNNAICHGNGYDPKKTVEVFYDVNSQRAEIVITDQGQGFRPKDIPDPTTDENIEKPSGRGIMLIRAYMDEMDYNESGNQVRMVKHNH